MRRDGRRTGFVPTTPNGNPRSDPTLSIPGHDVYATACCCLTLSGDRDLGADPVIDNG